LHRYLTSVSLNEAVLDKEDLVKNEELLMRQRIWSLICVLSLLMTLVAWDSKQLAASSSLARLAENGLSPSTASDTTSLEQANQSQQFVSLQQGLSFSSAGTSTIDFIVDQVSKTTPSIRSSVPVSMTLRAPNGQIITPESAQNNPSITYYEFSQPSSSFVAYIIDAPLQGRWQATIFHADQGSAVFENLVQSAAYLEIVPLQYTYSAGETVTIHTQLIGSQAGFSADSFATTLVYADQTRESLRLYDDGSHGDVTAGDGRWSGQFSAPNIPGNLLVIIQAKSAQIERYASTTFTIGERIATLGSPISSSVIDTNANGLYDQIVLSIPFTTSQAGRFAISAVLEDLTGSYRASSGASTDSLSPTGVGPGQYHLCLSFPTEELRRLGIGGPFRVRELVLADQVNPTIIYDKQRDSHTTAGYNPLDFEGPLVSLLEAYEVPVDTDGDGLFNQLDILLRVHVAKPGRYSWNARLRDSRDVSIGWAQGDAIISSGSVLLLSFDGRSIANNARSGPYELLNLAISSRENNLGVLVGELGKAIYTTSAYRPEQFNRDAGCVAERPKLTTHHAPTAFSPAQNEAAYRTLLPIVRQDQNGLPDDGGSDPKPEPEHGDDGTSALSSERFFVEEPYDLEARSRRFSIGTVDGRAFLSEQELTLAFIDDQGLLADLLRMRYMGMHTDVQLQPGSKQPGLVHRFKGADPAQWRSDLGSYSHLSYLQLYSGIDARFESADGYLKSTYIVTPSADPQQIRWAYTGAERISIDPQSGDLLIRLPAHSGQAAGRLIREAAPIAWQEDESGERIDIEVRFGLDSAQVVSFVLGDYDSSRALFIDPTLSYSSYFGLGHGDQPTAIAVDSDCTTFVAGSTLVSSIPSATAKVGDRIAERDLFVTAIGRDRKTVLATSYLGGSANEQLAELVLAPNGALALAGQSDSPDFPSIQAYRSSLAGGSDAVVAVLSADGSALSYSSYLGGNGEDGASALAVDAQGRLHIAGRTAGSFPTINAAQNSYGGGPFDAFVANIDPQQSGERSLHYSSYLGGSGDDQATGIGLDAQALATVVGHTSSENFPTQLAYQARKAGGIDAFISQIDPAAMSADSLRYSSFIGGSADDAATAVAVSSVGVASMLGSTSSSDLPSKNAYQPRYTGGQDSFLIQINPRVSGDGSLLYGSYLGGSGDDYATSIAVDGGGNLYLTGTSTSRDLATINAHYRSDRSDGSSNWGEYYIGGSSDVFLAHLTSDGQRMRYFTYLGGRGADLAQDLALDRAGQAFLLGSTDSIDLPLQSLPRLQSGKAFLLQFLAFE
jgi:hypothetical protein